MRIHCTYKLFIFLFLISASIPQICNLLPFWLAKKAIALAKYTWALYSQWRHSTTPSSSAKTDGAIKEQPSHGLESLAAKTSERTGKHVNGGVDKSKGEGESDEGSSKDKDGASSSGDGGSNVKHGRGKLIHRYCYMIVCELLHMLWMCIGGGQGINTVV